MNAHGQIAAALGGAFLILFFANGWMADAKKWVQTVTAVHPDGAGALPESTTPLNPLPGATPRFPLPGVGTP